MTQESPKAWTFYRGWDIFQELLVTALAPLTAEHLALRGASNVRTIEENVTHIIGARVRWCRGMMSMGDAAAFADWDREGEPVRSAEELVVGLRQSWHVLHDALLQWTVEDLLREYPNDAPDPDEPDILTHQWVMWHLIEHDIFHAGEISQILGAHGLAGLNL
jgi:uncharacterized damage-inducible protein DinB